MHRRLPIPILALSLALALPLVAGYASTRPPLLPQDPTGEPEGEPPTPLQEAMEGLQSGQRALRKLVRDPLANRDRLIETLREMEGQALTAFGQPPPIPEEVLAQDPDLEPVAWRIGFQRKLLEVADCLLETELAVHRGDAAGVTEGYKKLGALKKTGHDRYQ